MDIPFLKGCAIGFSIAAPVGPIGILCIRRSLADGALIGFFTGLGAATADAFYGAIAAFGLTIISNFLQEHQIALRLIGGAFLLYLGAKTFFVPPATQAAAPAGHATAFSSTFFLTLTNPTTILSFMVIFAGFGLSQRANNYASAALTTFGVFIGSAAWWLILSNSVSLLRTRVTPDWMRQINRLAGAIILAFGVVVLLESRGDRMAVRIVGVVLKTSDEKECAEKRGEPKSKEAAPYSFLSCTWLYISAKPSSTTFSLARLPRRQLSSLFHVGAL